MAITGTGTELAAQVMAKAIELIEGCAASCYATINGEIAGIRKNGARRADYLKEKLQEARGRGDGKRAADIEERLQEEERKTEESAARADREKDGVDLMLMETRLMLRSLEFHVRQMQEKQGS